MYADLGPGQIIDLDAPSPDGMDVLYSHEYVASAKNLYEYAESNPVGRIDPSGLDWLDCMSACISDNDPIGLALEAVIGIVVVGPVPKEIVARVADAVGDADFARRIRASMNVPGSSRLTTWPSALSAKVRAGGRSALRAFGRIATPVLIAYGNALAVVEVHCAGYCGGCWWYGVPDYDPVTGRISESLKSYFD